jgi:hypothetical protein
VAPEENPIRSVGFLPAGPEGYPSADTADGSTLAGVRWKSSTAAANHAARTSGVAALEADAACEAILLERIRQAAIEDVCVWQTARWPPARNPDYGWLARSGGDGNADRPRRRSGDGL